MNKLSTIETPRLVLRPLCAEDLADFYEYAKNPKVGPDAGWKPHESLEETRGYLEEFYKLEDVWAIAAHENGKMIGSIGLIEDEKRRNDAVRMLGYSLAEPAWGKGYMTEAARAVLRYGFDVLGLALISAYHYPDNHRSQRVIEKCGFRYEGRQRQAEVLFNGRICDELLYSITRDEYRAFADV
ncbi:MAG: GNAT family N-acetyltransferase [Clostridiales bacterium]|nr:MAG: GNAT family N-acetyltransferase [Clostridiales bacterium]